MNIEIKDVITLDNKCKYVVASKVVYENIIYYYLIDINDIKNILFCYQDMGELVEIEDRNLIQELLPLFYGVSKNILNEYINSN